MPKNEKQPADVRQRAYELWEKSGRGQGRDLDHWLQAEREMAEQQTGRKGAGKPDGQGGTDVPEQKRTAKGQKANAQKASDQKANDQKAKGRKAGDDQSAAQEAKPGNGQATDVQSGKPAVPRRSRGTAAAKEPVAKRSVQRGQKGQPPEN